METMGTCRDPDAFYDLLGEACENPGSGLCKLAMPRALAQHGSACLDLSYVRGDPSMPPLRPYVCKQATGGLATQCGLSSRSGAGPSAGTGSSTDTGPSTGASTGFAGSTVALTGLGALAVGAAGATGADLRRKLFGKAAQEGGGTPRDDVGDGPRVRVPTMDVPEGGAAAVDVPAEAALSPTEAFKCNALPLDCATRADMPALSDDPTEAERAAHDRAWASIDRHQIDVGNTNYTPEGHVQAHEDLRSTNPEIFEEVERNVRNRHTSAASLEGQYQDFDQARDDFNTKHELLKTSYCIEFPLFCHTRAERDAAKYKKVGGQSGKGLVSNGDRYIQGLLDGSIEMSEARRFHGEQYARFIGESSAATSRESREGHMKAVQNRHKAELVRLRA